MTSRFAIAVLLSVLAVVVHGDALKPTVQVTNGTLQGGQCPSGAMNYFLSIPYADAPIEDLRFAPPRLYNFTYGGIRDASRAAPSCPQFGASFIDYQGGQSEDCLFIDIWTPVHATHSSNLPVKVWIFGGGDQAGGISWPLYDGCTADTAAVHVHINYRLGPLGFMALESAGITGNYGLQDLIVGLQWVQANIQAFGGDKDKVVVYGQSAGALNTHALASLDIAPLLMKSAIMESGAGQMLPNMSQANAFAAVFVAALPCNLSDISCLRAATPEQMNTTYLNMFAGESEAFVFVGFGWEPVAGSDLVPAQPTDLGLKVPSLIGSTAQEGTLFVYETYGDAVANLTAADYDLSLVGNFGASLAATVNATYPLLLYDDTSKPVFYALAALATFEPMHCPAYRALRSGASTGVPVYTYSFNHTPSCSWMPGIPQDVLAELGPAHTSELPFVFGGVHNLPFGTGPCNFTDGEVALSAFIQAAWTSMAENGNPGVGWPEFSVNSTEGIIFNDVPVSGTVDYSMCSFWDEITAELSAA
ncbi:Alpha/Beta hydrolase protein [Xylariales sp. PMI_506]|nr:Alpha/Beta hydrolase protein [Xylariales sp. PMI_506]